MTSDEVQPTDPQRKFIRQEMRDGYGNRPRERARAMAFLSSVGLGFRHNNVTVVRWFLVGPQRFKPFSPPPTSLSPSLKLQAAPVPSARLVGRASSDGSGTWECYLNCHKLTKRTEDTFAQDRVNLDTCCFWEVGKMRGELIMPRGQ